MPTLTFSAATSSTGSAFRAFSGVYTFTINGIPENATVNQITFSCAEGAFTRYTNDSSVGTTESVNAKYQMFYSIGSSSSYQPSTSGSTPNTLAVGNSNCYSITDTKIITLTGSSAIPTTVKWTVNSDYMSKFSNGKRIYIYFARTSLVASGTGRTMLQYNTVGGKKGQLICTIEYTLPISSLQAPTITSLIPTTGSTSYTISWNSVAGATSYKVKYRLSGSSSWSSTGNIYSTTYSGSVSSFGTWQFQIEASNSTNTTTSAIVSASFSAVSTPSIIFEPNINYSSLKGTSVELSWNSFTIQNATYQSYLYGIYYKKVTNGIIPNNYTSFGSTRNNDYTFTASDFINSLGASEGAQYVFGISATAYGVSNVSSGYLASGIKWSSKIFTYSTGSTVNLKAPGKPEIIQSDTYPTFSLSWEAAEGTGGTGSITYEIRNVSDNLVLVEGLTGTEYSGLAIPDYDYLYSYAIRAHYSGQQVQSESNTIQFQAPYLTDFNKVLISPTSGENVKISWEELELKYTKGAIGYILQYSINNGTYQDYTNELGTSQVFSTSPIELDIIKLNSIIKLNDRIKFKLIGLANELTNEGSGAFLIKYSDETSEFIYIQDSNLIGYYVNGAWQECTVYYYGRNSTTQQYEWIECIPYYYKDGWQEINTKIE